MAQILVRKIPDDVMEGIRTAAQNEGVSVEEFARRVLRYQAERRNHWHEFVKWSTRFRSAQKARRTRAEAAARAIRARPPPVESIRQADHEEQGAATGQTRA